jgi:phospholipase C
MAAGTSLLSQINHIVVVMLENRSFDHMLGFLYQSSNNVSPLGQPFEGLTGKESNLDANGKTVTVFPIKASDPHPYLQPGADPGEGYLNTNSQLFGKSQAPAPITPANNGGFVTNFANTLASDAKNASQVMPGTQPSQIMAMYTPVMLPVLSNLAAGYAVCDHWYASAPTETFPNRAFASLATSQGFVQDKSCSIYTAPSIFTALAKKSVSWTIYGYDAPALMRGAIADIKLAPETHFGEFPDFQKAAKTGNLANYCFLEPQWGTQGNSQHPNYDVSKGEQFLHDIYYSLIGTPVWNQTLVIITYDEHGGCYDHVPPPENAVPPDNSSGELNFDFKRFGLRVPTVLVSPMIAAGTVFRTSSATPFDHTSILATVEKRFGVPSLTKRDAAAPDVGAVLTSQKLRSDDPLNGVKVPVSAVAPPTSRPDKFEAAIAASAADLPIAGTGNGHHHEPPAFATGEAAKEYARRRYQQFAQQSARHYRTSSQAGS